MAIVAAVPRSPHVAKLIRFPRRCTSNWRRRPGRTGAASPAWWCGWSRRPWRARPRELPRVAESPGPAYRAARGWGEDGRCRRVSPGGVLPTTPSVRRYAAGRLPRPRDVACTGCGAQAAEYHHHKGYAPEHRLDVVAVCRSCHRREGWNGRRGSVRGTLPGAARVPGDHRGGPGRTQARSRRSINREVELYIEEALDQRRRERLDQRETV